MARTFTPQQWAARANSFASDLRTVETRSTQAAALAAKDAILPFERAASGGDLRLSGVGKRGAKIGVRYDLKAGTAFVRATGPAHLIERDTKAHVIPRQRRRGRRRVIVIPGVGVRASAMHPGTKGKHPWARGTAVAAKAAPAAAAKVVHGAFVKAFG